MTRRLLPHERSPFPRGIRRTLIGVLRHRGKHEEVERMICDAIVAARGNLSAAIHLLDISRARIYVLLPQYPRAQRVLRAERERRRGAPRWVVRTLAVLERGVMEKTAAILEAASTMTVEQIEAEVAASRHAGRVDAQALAEAIAASSAPADGAG